MAKVRILLSEIDEGLPAVCMKCGNLATVDSKKDFSWYPPWVIAFFVIGILPGAIIASVLTRRMTVHMPMCDRHRSYLAARTRFTFGGLAALGILGALALLVHNSPERQAQGSALGGYLCAGVGVLAMAWLVTVAVLQHLSIRPTEITSHDITLTNVAIGFEDALLDQREHHREAPPRRRRRSLDADPEFDVDGRYR